MFNISLSCLIFLLYSSALVLCLPMSILFGKINVIKIETPFRLGFELKTSFGSPNIMNSLPSETISNRFSTKQNIPNKLDATGIESNFSMKRFQNESMTASSHSGNNGTNSYDKITTFLPFNDDNSITNDNQEVDYSTISNTEYTTDFYNTEDYENATMQYEEGVLNRSAVSPAMLASLLG